jgi:flagellar M-ring protein FliF
MLATMSRLTPIQKIGLGAAVLTLVAGAVVLSRSGSDPAMAAVYTDLEPRDAAAVTDELISRGVDYDLADGGRTVLVPADQVYDLRIGLSGEGLPSSSEGYALLDRQGITTSEFRQRIDYQRALEGELARTLRSIDGIDSATVHLALPEESVFVDEPAEPTASVLVRSNGTAPITSNQVSAMVHLVASSVKGMTPENVTIADASGAVLSAGGETGGVSTAGGAANDAAAAVEREVGTELRTMIGRVAGFENVAVTVRADVDLTERQSTTESFDSSAEGGVVVTERTASETYTGADQEGTTGVLGPDGAPVDSATPGNSESTYSKDDAERTYAVNRTVESTTYVPGTVTRLSVAVLVDEAKVTEEQRAAIEQMVGTAAGIDLERGDQVVVTRLPFDTASSEAAVEAAAVEAAEVAAAERSSMIRTAVIAAIVMIAMLLAYRSSRRSRREVATPIDIGAIRAARLDEPETLAVPAAPPVPVDPATQASRDALDELSALADRRPDEVAQILQSWLSEEGAGR